MLKNLLVGVICSVLCARASRPRIERVADTPWATFVWHRYFVEYSGPDQPIEPRTQFTCTIQRIGTRGALKMNRLLLIITAALLQPAFAQDILLPDATDPNFCQAVQKYMSSTEVDSDNTVFTDMPEYRHSKPLVDPLQTFQVVSYSGQMPVMVSCKIKGAAHLRDAYGDDAAGEQKFCPDVTKLMQAQAVAELRGVGQAAAAAKAEALVIDNNEPYMTGQDYLSDFELSYADDDGAIHLQSPGLFHDYDSWTTWILPEKFEGQVYCHLATPAYMKVLATGEMEPGIVMTTADDAPVTPQ